MAAESLLQMPAASAFAFAGSRPPSSRITCAIIRSALSASSRISANLLANRDLCNGTM